MRCVGDSFKQQSKNLAHCSATTLFLRGTDEHPECEFKKNFEFLKVRLCAWRLTPSLPDLSGSGRLAMTSRDPPTCSDHHPLSRPSAACATETVKENTTLRTHRHAHSQVEETSGSPVACQQRGTPATSDTLRRLPAVDGLRSFPSLSDTPPPPHTHTHTRAHDICCFNPSWVFEHCKMVELCLEAAV